MAYKFNPLTGDFDLIEITTLFEIDAGFANSVYLSVQNLDGGSA